MINQRQPFSSLLTHPPVKADAMGLILQICCWGYHVMASEVFGTQEGVMKLKGDFCV